MNVTMLSDVVSTGGELGSPPFCASKCKIRIITLVPLIPECLLSNGGKILILHFDAQNGGEPNSLI